MIVPRMLALSYAITSRNPNKCPCQNAVCLTTFKRGVLAGESTLVSAMYHYVPGPVVTVSLGPDLAPSMVCVLFCQGQAGSGLPYCAVDGLL